MLLEIAIPCLLIAGPWYAFHWRATVGNAIDAGFGMSAIVQGTGPIFSLGAISGYLRIVAERGVSFYYIALLVLSILLLLLRRQFQSLRELSLLVWWITPFLVFLFGGNKDVRYIAPILPAFALTVACLLDAALERWKPLLFAILLPPLANMLAVSFHWPYASRDIGYAAHYNPNTWLHDEILRTIADDTLVHPGQKKLILIATDRGFFNADNFKLTAVQNGLPFEMATTAYEPNSARLFEMANDASYVIYKEGGEPESAFFNTRGADLIARLRKSPDWSEVAFGQALPDGGVARILRHR